MKTRNKFGYSRTLECGSEPRLSAPDPVFLQMIVVGITWLFLPEIIYHTFLKKSHCSLCDLFAEEKNSRFPYLNGMKNG